MRKYYKMAGMKLDFFFNYRNVLQIITGGVIKTFSSLVTPVVTPSKQLAIYYKFNKNKD